MTSISNAERLPIKTYTVADGLLRDYVYKIKQDSHGFLWFCTPGGISRFDGYAFTNFTTADGLPADWIFDLHETGDGQFWVATNRGLCKWQVGENSVCKTYTAKMICAIRTSGV